MDSASSRLICAKQAGWGGTHLFLYSTQSRTRTRCQAPCYPRPRLGVCLEELSHLGQGSRDWAGGTAVLGGHELQQHRHSQRRLLRGGHTWAPGCTERGQGSKMGPLSCALHKPLSEWGWKPLQVQQRNSLGKGSRREGSHPLS